MMGIQRSIGSFVALRLPYLRPSQYAENRADAYLAAVRLRNSSIRLLFLFIVCLPTVVATIYYGLFASKQYVSEAKYIVRGVASHRTTGLDALLSTFGISRAADDTFAIQDFIQSRDAVRQVEARLPLRAIFSRNEADAIASFPHFWQSDSFEMLYEYFQHSVSVLQDASKGITTLTVTTFRPEDSRAIAATLLSLAEAMVNRMNDRAETDTVANARAEVQLAEERVISAQAELTAFRNHELLVDPAQSSVGILQTITTLSTDLAQTSAQITEALKNAPGSPMIDSLQTHATALQQRIALERAKMGGDDEALSSKVSAYEHLTLLRDLADKSLAAALSALEIARQESRRQKIYIEEIATPNLPDEDTEPQRVRSVLTVFVMSMAVFAMVWILMAGAKEHAQ